MISHHKKQKTPRGIMHANGFVLISELIAIFIFGITLLALTRMMSDSLYGINQNIQMTHAGWMLQDIVTRMQANEARIRSGDYMQNNLSFNCNGTYTQTHQLDIQSVFCATDQENLVRTSASSYISELNWDIQCNDIDGTDGDACSIGSTISLSISWFNNESEDNNLDNSTLVINRVI